MPHIAVGVFWYSIGKYAEFTAVTQDRLSVSAYQMHELVLAYGTLAMSFSHVRY